MTPTSNWLLQVLLISPLFSTITASLFTHSYSQCLDDQKTLLLQLKNELIFGSSISGKLVQWNQTEDCYNWYGVECDRAGHVISLQLDEEAILGGIRDSSSLFRFRYLEKLNLAYNSFNYSHIPRGIHNLTSLTHLNLSYAGFCGQVPIEISSLKRLLIFDISSYSWISPPQILEVQNLGMLLHNLTGLRELYLDGVNISSNESRNWSHIISSSLPNLMSLSLWHVSGPLVTSFWRLPLTILRLDETDLSTVNPNYLANFSGLTTLSLVSCQLKGYFPEVIFQLPNLQILDLGGNQLEGPIPTTFANLTKLFYVDLSNNFFTGSLSNIVSSLFGLSSLLTLRLNNNRFSGKVDQLPIVNASNLVSLNLWGNQLEGPIPNSLFQLQSLKFLFLSNNLFNGTFQLEKIQAFVNLTSLDLSGNKLSVRVGGNLNSSSFVLPQLQVLNLASCDMYDFPHFIKNSPDMWYLGLSNNRIVGEIPSWIWQTQLEQLNLSQNLFSLPLKPFYIPASLQFLDIHSNHLHGDLHLHIPPRTGNLTSKLLFLSLANNSLRGSIPASLCHAMHLGFLDLSINKLSGSIPPCLHLDRFELFNLGRNNISGHIPDNFTKGCSLHIFDLSNNTSGGNIPKSIKNCEGLELINVGNNIIRDTFPCMLSSSLRVLILHSNRFHGEVICQKSWPDLQILDISSNKFSGSLESINFSSWRTMTLQSDPQLRPKFLGSGISFGSYLAGVTITMKGIEVELVKIWPDFTSIDLSYNNFQGEIPTVVGVLRSLHLLNLSHNTFNNTIPKTLGALRKLESLDISVNRIKGTIPEELAQLTFLSFLNVSYNKLVGKIPNGPQFQTFPVDSFRGNPGLYGFPLNTSNRNSSGSDSSPPEHKKEAIMKRENEWEYVSAALGYVVGLGSIVWLLLFCPRFRVKYFEKIEEVVEERFNGGNRRRRRARRVVKNQGRRH